MTKLLSLEEDIVSKSLTLFLKIIFQSKLNLKGSMTAGQEMGPDLLWNISYFRLTRYQLLKFHRNLRVKAELYRLETTLSIESPLRGKGHRLARVPSHSESSKLLPGLRMHVCYLKLFWQTPKGLFPAV